MNIGINKGYKTVQFKDVDVGQCFIHNHTLYMKVNVFADNTNKIRGIDLSTGLTGVFLADDKVDLVNCRLVLE